MASNNTTPFDPLAQPNFRAIGAEQRVVELEAALSRVRDWRSAQGGYSGDGGLMFELDELLETVPYAALDAHNAQVKAEALEWVADSNTLPATAAKIRPWLRARAAEIRKAAQ